jgi:hypothetical protein
MEIDQMDIKITFINGDLKEKIYNILETTWKQTRNERFKVHEMEQLH